MHALLHPYESEILSLQPFRVDKEMSKESVRKYNNLVKGKK